jgi:large subunit ribosomal protein L5
MAKGNRADKGGKKGKKKDDGYVAYKRESAPSLKAKYQSEIKDKLKTEFGYENVMQIPGVVKVSINMGLGRAVANPKLIESAVEELRAISGQAPVVCAAKRDIATFKLRKGHKIGTSVTLRGDYMWEFLDRLINIALPQVRDFRGVSPKAFDGRGNYSLGIKEQIIFPEIDYDQVDEVKGMNITIVTTAKTDAEARALLKHLGMPFRVPSKEAQAAA